MKRIKLFMIIIVVLQSNTIYAQTKYYYFRFGSNISQFRNEGTARGSGMIIGAGWGYDDNNPAFINGFVNLEVLYSQKKASINNVTWPSNPPWDSSRYPEIGDINMSIRHIEMPLKFGYYINISNRGKFKLFSGLSLALPIKNESSRKIKDYIANKHGEDEEYNYDYEWVVTDRTSNLLFDCFENIKNTTFNLNFGTILSWSFINLEFRYSYALSDTKNFMSLTVHDKVDTYYMMLGISL